MNNLLFIALIIALLYYFFIYLPQQKKSNPDPDKKTFTPPPTTPTDPEIKFPSATTEQESGMINFPSILSEPKAKSLSQAESKELEKTLDYLIKGMEELNREIDNF